MTGRLGPVVVLAVVLVHATGCRFTERFGSGAKKKALLAEASKRMDDGDAAGAVERLIKARQIDPKDGAVLARLGVALVAAGRAAEALSPLREAAEAGPTGSAALLPLGRLLRLNRSYDQALDALKRALEVERDKGPVLVELGVAYWLSNRVKEAADTLSAAASEVPDSFSARFHLGEVFRAKEDYGRARTELEAALRASPDSRYAQFALAETLFAVNELSQAEELYRKVVAVNKPFPRTGRTFFQLAVIAHRKRQVPQALGNLDLAEKAGYDPDLVALWRARVNLAARKLARAREALSRLLGKEERYPQVTLLSGRLALAAGDPAAALVHLERAARLKLDQAEVQAALGSAYLGLLEKGGSPEALVPKAVAAFTRCVNAQPKSREAQLGLARIYSRWHLDLALAATHVKVYLQTYPGDGEALSLLGQLLARQGQVAEALEQVDGAIAAGRNDRHLELLRAALLLASTRPKEAEEAAVAGIQKARTDLYGRLVLVAIYSRTGRLKLASSSLKELAGASGGSTLEPSQWSFYEAIGRTLGPEPTAARRDPSAPGVERRLKEVQAELDRLAAAGASAQTAVQSLEVLRGLVEDMVSMNLSGQLAAPQRDAMRQALDRLLAQQG